MDLRQSPLWAEYMRHLGWKTEKIADHYVYIYPFLFWKFSKIPRFTSSLDLKKVDQFLKKEGVLLAKLEPDFSVTNQINSQFSILNFQFDKWALAPTKTIVLNLLQSLEDLLMEMEKDTRYSVRTSAKRGVKVRESTNFEQFYLLYQQTSKRGKFWIESKKNLLKRWEIFSKEGEAKIFTAYFKKEPLASAMVFYHESTAYYLYAGSSKEKRGLFAPYLLVWEIIKDAKKRGFKKLDLEGIYDPRIPSTKSWQGFSLFKKGFRGEELTSAGTFTKVYNPLLSKLFKLADKFW